MEDGVTEGLVFLFATIFTKMSFLYFVNCTLLFSTDIQAKYFSLTGFPCFTMHFGLRGLVFSHSSLIE
jgi:hypothetical protein